MRAAFSTLIASMMPLAAAAATIEQSSGIIVPGYGVLGDRPSNFDISWDEGSPGECSNPFGTAIGGSDQRGDVLVNANEQTNVRLAPDVSNTLGSENNISCFLSVGATAAEDGSLTIDFLGEIASRIGFYWGSPDPYNEISFFTASGNVVFGALGTTITGDEATAAAGTAPFTSGYFYFEFETDEPVIGFTARSIGNTAFELDNLSVSLRSPNAFAADRRLAAPRPAQSVPAPAGMALLGLALIGVYRLRR